MKITWDKMYKDRLEQIETDLKKEYYKRGPRKNKSIIAKLLQEKERIEKDLIKDAR